MPLHECTLQCLNSLPLSDGYAVPIGRHYKHPVRGHLVGLSCTVLVVALGRIPRTRSKQMQLKRSKKNINTLQKIGKREKKKNTILPH